MSIIENINNLRNKISVTEKRFKRRKSSVSLLAVSKTRSIETIIAAISQGQLHFGENYCQEAVAKIEAINNPNLIWHFIGPIQSNKTKQISSYFILRYANRCR